jgi:hypothetical protein
MKWNGNLPTKIRIWYVLLPLLLSGTVGCKPRAPRPNQIQGVPSPSGKYILRVPIEAQTRNPEYKGTKVWKVTITDPGGAILYKDEESTMVGYLNVYWGWDARDRAWVYNSDDGQVWRWELARDEWKKVTAGDEETVPDFVAQAMKR